MTITLKRDIRHTTGIIMFSRGVRLTIDYQRNGCYFFTAFGRRYSVSQDDVAILLEETNE